jgi:hypothetical protein
MQMKKIVNQKRPSVKIDGKNENWANPALPQPAGGFSPIVLIPAIEFVQLRYCFTTFATLFPAFTT